MKKSITMSLALAAMFCLLSINGEANADTAIINKDSVERAYTVSCSLFNDTFVLYPGSVERITSPNLDECTIKLEGTSTNVSIEDNQQYDIEGNAFIRIR